MKDKIGKRPKITDPKTALENIKKISKDKRDHVLLEDYCGWLELKLKECGNLATIGLRLIENERQTTKNINLT